MSVMTIKELIEANRKTGEGNPFEILTNEDIAKEKMKLINELAVAHEENAEKAKDIVLTKISEETFVKLATSAQNFTLTAMVSNGMGIELLEAHMSGELKGYTHTVFLAILGALINDEVI